MVVVKMRGQHGRLLTEIRKRSRSIYIQWVCQNNAGIHLRNFNDAALSKLILEQTEFNEKPIEITFDEAKNMYIIPRETADFFFTQLLPYCKERKYNIINIPEFVKKIITHQIFNEKLLKKGQKVGLKKPVVKKKKTKKKKGEEAPPEEEKPKEPELTKDDPMYRETEEVETGSVLDALPHDIIKNLFKF